MDGDGYTNDPFEKEQRRLKRLFDELSSGSEHEESDPYEDEGEYGSDQDYVPNENSSESDVENDKADLSANSEADSDPNSDQDLSPSSSRTVFVQQAQNNEDSDWEDTTTDIPEFDFDEASNCLKITLDDNSSPLQVFEKLFTPEIEAFILQCSNDYGNSLVKSTDQKLDIVETQISAPFQLMK